MLQLSIYLTAVVCLLFNAQSLPRVLADSSNATLSAAADEHDDDRPQSIADWFKKYDQIRRNAEMTLGEKLQMRSIVDKGLNGVKQTKSNSALAQRMISKYAQAGSAMQNLAAVAETKELQDGYAHYFVDAEQLIKECLESQPNDSGKPVPAAMRTSLEQLDRKNKELDACLRKKYGIVRHRHI